MSHRNQENFDSNRSNTTGGRLAMQPPPQAPQHTFLLNEFQPNNNKKFDSKKSQQPQIRRNDSDSASSSISVDSNPKTTVVPQTVSTNLWLPSPPQGVENVNRSFNSSQRLLPPLAATTSGSSSTNSTAAVVANENRRRKMSSASSQQQSATFPQLVKNLQNFTPTLVKKPPTPSIPMHPPKSNRQAKVYNFLERPTGWKCFIYHFTVYN